MGVGMSGAWESSRCRGGVAISLTLLQRLDFIENLTSSKFKMKPLESLGRRLARSNLHI
jgi:hypothetical protein